MLLVWWLVSLPWRMGAALVRPRVRSRSWRHVVRAGLGRVAPAWLVDAFVWLVLVDPLSYLSKRAPWSELLSWRVWFWFATWMAVNAVTSARGWTPVMGLLGLRVVDLAERQQVRGLTLLATWATLPLQPRGLFAAVSDPEDALLEPEPGPPAEEEAAELRRRLCDALGVLERSGEMQIIHRGKPARQWLVVGRRAAIVVRAVPPWTEPLRVALPEWSASVRERVERETGRELGPLPLAGLVVCAGREEQETVAAREAPVTVVAADELEDALRALDRCGALHAETREALLAWMRSPSLAS